MQYYNIGKRKTLEIIFIQLACDIDNYMISLDKGILNNHINYGFEGKGSRMGLIFNIKSLVL